MIGDKKILMQVEIKKSPTKEFQRKETTIAKEREKNNEMSWSHYLDKV